MIKLHERCLQKIYNDKKSSFQELLESDKSVPIHIKNLQVLATEMFKVYRDISPPIMRQLFQSRNNNNANHTFKMSVLSKIQFFFNLVLSARTWYFLL